MVESKQVKVDNWGIFFLQRLQHFFNKTFFCDLTLQFDNNVQLKVHRLVLNACTEYFRLLEQTSEAANDCLIMPSELQADVVVPIVNFMYTGILEFHEPIFNRLYSAAQLLNMTVLLKLLDAQKAPILPIPRPQNRRGSSHVTWNLHGKKIAPRTTDPDLPEPFPGRQLPVWRRRSVPAAYRKTDLPTDPMVVKYYKREVDDSPKPTRFEWPEEEDANFDTSSFDEISYTSRPITAPARDKSPRPSTSNFEELKRSTVKRSAPATSVVNAPPSKRVNIQDVKEYLREQKLRSDYIGYDEAEAADNDLQTYNDDDSADEAPEKNGATDEPPPEDTPSKSILKSDSSTSHNKRVRFSLEEKENSDEKAPEATASKSESTVDMSNHTKIITEVLKKYPYLVRKNKNIRLKILAKGSSPAGVNAASKSTAANTTSTSSQKSTSKVSYMVMKPDAKSTGNEKRASQWTCGKCTDSSPPQFESYYLFRKHLTEVHQEKADSQMCNICGHTSRKQNMLVYHKFVKHGVEPPAMYQFPKCAACDYVALSNTLLAKHQHNHAHGPLACAECGTSYPNKAAMLNHSQLTGHVTKPEPDSVTTDCSYCASKFILDEALFTHMRISHREEAIRDGLISPDEAAEKKPTEEELGPLAPPASAPPAPVEKPKDKIKILSNVKLTKPASELLRTPLLRKQAAPESDIKVEMQTQEPSSEAESLSNVASGIAASLGLVNTIVVLDDNQFILQSQDGTQERTTPAQQNEYIIPDISSIENMSNLHVTQHQVITSESNAIISQAALSKANIASTDELVMVLTDHDYSDASNNTVLAPNSSNIVVLYSHPVQGQDGTQYMSQPANLMLNTEMGLMEVDEQYAVANGAALPHKQCEESIEMIQQEINSQLEPEATQLHAHSALEQAVVPFSGKIGISNESQFNPAQTLPAQIEQIEKTDVVAQLQLTPQVQQVQTAAEVSNLQRQVATYEEPMETEESIEMIQKEIQNSAELRVVQNEAVVQQNIVQTNVPYVESVLEESQVQRVHEECEENPNELVENEDPNEVAENEDPHEILENEDPHEIVENEDPNEIVESVDPNERVDENEDANEIVESGDLNEIIESGDPNEIVGSADPNELVGSEDPNEIVESGEPHEIVESEDPIESSDLQSQHLETSEDMCHEGVDTLPETVTTIESSPEQQQQEDEEEVAVLSDTPSCEDEKQLENEKQFEGADASESTPPENVQTNDGLEEPVEPTAPNESTEEPPPEMLDEIKQELIENEEDMVHNQTVVVPSKGNLNELTCVEIKDEMVVEDSDVAEEVGEIQKVEQQIKELDKQQQGQPDELIGIKTEDSAMEETPPSPVAVEQPVEEEIPKDNCEKMVPLRNPKISKLLDDWDDGDTDSQQSDVPKTTPVATSSINTLIDDWDDEEDT